MVDLLTDASLLEKKGLYDQYAKKLKSAKALSKKYEKHLVTLEILDREILFILGQKTKALDTNLKQLQEDVKHTTQLIKIEFEYKEILHRIFTWYRTKNKIRDQAAIAEITALKKTEILEDASSAITFQSKICFFFSHALFHHILGQDLHKSNLYYQKVVEIWERYTYMKSENYKLYKIHLSNYLNSCHSIKKYTPFPEVLEKITRLPAYSFDEQAEEFQNVVYLKLLFYMNTLQLEEAIQLIPEIKSGIEKYQSKINKARELSFYCNIALLFFAMEDYDQTSSWIDKILIDQGIDHRTDVQRFARVMQLIVHYELENLSLLENLNRSIYRNLKKRKELHQFEQIVLTLIKKIQNVINEKQRISLLKDFHQKLKKIQQENIQKKIIGLAEIEMWVFSKIERKSYLEVLREKTPVS